MEGGRTLTKRLHIGITSVSLIHVTFSNTTERPPAIPERTRQLLIIPLVSFVNRRWLFIPEPVWQGAIQFFSFRLLFGHEFARL